MNALDLFKTVNKNAQISLREIFADSVCAGEFKNRAVNEPEIFHQILIEAKNADFIHYSRLSAAIGLKDSSNASRWFLVSDQQKTPDQIKRKVIIQYLEKIIRHDIQRLQENKPAIGGLSVKAHPSLEIQAFS